MCHSVIGTVQCCLDQCTLKRYNDKRCVRMIRHTLSGRVSEKPEYCDRSLQTSSEADLVLQIDKVFIQYGDEDGIKGPFFDISLQCCMPGISMRRKKGKTPTE